MIFAIIAVIIAAFVAGLLVGHKFGHVSAITADATALKKSAEAEAAKVETVAQDVAKIV